MVASPLAAPGWVAPGRRVYAVGDVHGCAGRMDVLHGRIAADLAARPVQNATLVHLGDYIDRGPDSAGVVARLAAGALMPGTALVNLRGNHEQMMLDALAGTTPEAADDWRLNGAAATLASWSIPARTPTAAWAGLLPPRDLAWLRALPLYHAVDGYLFVHAGVRPGVPLARQSADDMLWIRQSFLHCTSPLLPDAPALAVVHGHTPAPSPEVTQRRINVDTGAVRGGALTCAVLEGRSVQFLTA